MGQIWDFLRSVSVHLGAPFGANLTDFGVNPDSPDELFLLETWFPRSPFTRDGLLTDLEATVGTYELCSNGGEK